MSDNWISSDLSLIEKSTIFLSVEKTKIGLHRIRHYIANTNPSRFYASVYPIVASFSNVIDLDVDHPISEVDLLKKNMLPLI